MGHTFKGMAHAILRKLTGFDIVRYSSFNFNQLRRSQLLSKTGIGCVIDVGANNGQYGRELRAAGYRGRIVSFEPLSHALAELSAQAARDPLWICRKAAMGDRNCRTAINVAGNSVSSSILPMLAAHSDAAPESRYVATEDVAMVTLEAVFPEVASEGDNIWLKLDVQGFEKQVLDGAGKALDKVCAIEMELTMTPLYENQTLYMDMIQRLARSGFSLAMINPGLRDPRSGLLLQADGIFLRQEF